MFKLEILVFLGNFITCLYATKIPDENDINVREIKSQITTLPGHYPSMLCKIQLAALNATGEYFVYAGTQDYIKNVCVGSTLDVWDIRAFPRKVTLDFIRYDPNEANHCHEIHDIGMVFLVFYWAKSSNYFHLHYDTVLPLFKFMHQYAMKVPESAIVLMPSVETTRLQKIDWDTDAFNDKAKYWNEIIRLLAGKRNIMPLNRALLKEKRNLCFKELYLGTMQHAHNMAQTSTEHIPKYVYYIWKQLKISPFKTFKEHRVGIISRKNRRRILNEDELVSVVKPFAEVDLLTFEKMTVKEQIQSMQKYTVLVGVNGAGLMNGLYLPRYGVAVQIVPYNCTVNWKEFGAILQARGPYLVYHNEHPDRSVTKPHDRYNNNPDTNVHPEEFKDLIQKALKLVEKTARGEKEEL